MNIYYYANQVYQSSFAKLVYKELGGIFVVSRLNRKLRLIWYLRFSQRNKAINKIFYKIPDILVIDTHKTNNLNGLIITNGNTFLNVGSRCIKVFMGHGTGDKPYGGSAENLNTNDYLLISGEKHMEKIRDSNIKIPDEKLIKIGNPRFDELINNNFNKETYMKSLGIRDSTRKIILYAPTWEWGNGTLHTYFYSFCKSLSKKYNLIVRPHYHDRKYIPRLKFWLIKENINNVYITNPANFLVNDTIYDMAISDALISDTSSIIYEYLITKNPIILLDSGFKDLHKMPPHLDIKTISDFYDGSMDISFFLKDTFEKHDLKTYETMLDNCFYFNDGQSNQRIIDFFKSIEHV